MNRNIKYIVNKIIIILIVALSSVYIWGIYTSYMYPDKDAESQDRTHFNFYHRQQSSVESVIISLVIVWLAITFHYCKYVLITAILYSLLSIMGLLYMLFPISYGIMGIIATSTILLAIVGLVIYLIIKNISNKKT